MSDFSRRAMLGLMGSAAALPIVGSARAAKPIKIGFSQATMNHPWRIAMVEVTEAYVEANLPNVELIITNGNTDNNKQVADVESLMVQGIDVLMISPLTAGALSPIVAEVMSSGTPVLTIDRAVNTEVTSHIGALNLPIGEAAAEFLIKKHNGKARIIELQGTAGASATVDRNIGFENGLAGHPGMEIVASHHANYLQEKAMKFMEDAVQRFGADEFDAIYAHADEMAFGAIQALKEAGRREGISVIAINGANLAIDAVANGEMDATFTYPYVAPEGIQYAYKVAMGETIDKEIILDSVAITPENVNQYIGKGY